VGDSQQQNRPRLCCLPPPAEQDKAEDVLRFFVADTAADGTFAFNNLPPGRYWTLAQPPDPQTATLITLGQPEAATARAKLRRTAESQKSEIQLKPCQNLQDYQLKEIHKEAQKAQ
jgi:hypothetical protein